MDDSIQAHPDSLHSSGQLGQRLDAEWTALNAIREMLGIALKGAYTPTYAQALDVGKVIAPQIYDTDASPLGRGREPKLVREYRQKADALSQVRGHLVSPIETLDEDIEYQRRLAATSGDRDQILTHLKKLESIRPYFLPRTYTENQLIIRDKYEVQRDLPKPPTEVDEAKDYETPNGRGLRIRMLHPDPPEHSTGADLIYEQYWEGKQMARIALVQYKIWNGKTLYLSQAKSLEAQMEKMRQAFCETGLCKPYKDNVGEERYRLPYCSSFLRPTDQLQDADSRLLSRALHTPICVAFRALEETGRGNRKIESKRIRGESVSHKVFEELFNVSILGSRWLTYQEIEKLYRDHKILKPEDRIVLHAQEY